MKHIIKIIIIFFFIALDVNAQNIIGFKRSINSFYVFDTGVFHQLEYRSVKSFKEGAYYMTYINDKNEFKIYRNGRSHFLDEGSFIKNYTVSNHLMTFVKENQLSVWDNNRVKILTTWVGDYTVTDSLVTFYDDILKSFRTYYNGRIYNLEVFQNVYPLLSHKTGKNVLAYIDRNMNFNIFYRGNSELISRLYDMINFDAGTDIVAFEAEDAAQFRIYYKGQILNAEQLKPLEFKTGDELVAYIDAAGTFKIFEKGILYNISRFSPSYYDVKDNLVIFADSLNYFSVFTGGQVHKLEEIQPQSYLSDRGNVAYLDHQGRLKIFTEGKVNTVSYERIVSYLRGNVVVYETGSLSGNIWYKRNVY